MSLAMIESVKRLKTSPTQKLLLFVLADCHNEKTGQCNPSYRYLMEVTGLSNKAVANNLKSLRDSGAMFYDSRNGANSHYLLTPAGYILTAKPVNLVHKSKSESSEPSSQVQKDQPVNLVPEPVNLVPKSSEPSSQVQKDQPVNLVPEPVNLVPKSSEPSSHKPVLTVEPELLLIAELQSPKVTPEIQKPKKTRKKKEKTGDPRHCQFIEIFAECYRTAFDAKWVMAKGKDGKHLKGLLSALPDLTAETWREALEWCQDTSQKEGRYAPKIIATGNLSAFCSNWSAIVAYSQTYQEPK